MLPRSKPARSLPAGASSDTKGKSITVVKRTENSGATTRIKMTVDGVQLATSADVPDVSNFATLDYVQNNYETTAHASATYQKIADASEIKTIKAAKHTVTVENGVADIGGTTVSRDDSQTSTNSYSVVTVKQNLPATADATGDEGASFVISKAGTLQGVWQNISIDGVNVVTAYELNFRLSNLLSKAEAENTYLKIADASPIKSISQGGTATTPDANGNVNVRFVYVAAGSNSGKKTLFVRSTTDNINYGDNLIVEFAETGGKQSDCEMYAQYTDENTQGSKGNTVRIATKDELTDATAGMATQTWVQQYVASLDGTNISA